MPSKRIEITVSDETLKRLDAARGFEAKASFVKRALERALCGGDPDGSGMRPVVAERPAPVRASVEQSPVRKVYGQPQGECPVARCDLSGPVGEKCRNHPNMRFKA